MKRYQYKNFLYPFIIGLVLYFIDVAISILPYKTNSTESFIFYLVSIFIVSAILVIFALIYKKPAISIVLLRSLVWFISYVVIFIINGYMGTLYCIYDIMNLDIEVERNNISGLLTLTFIVFLLIVSTVTTLIFIIMQKTKKRITKHGNMINN